MDVKINFPEQFCFRYTLPEVCTTKTGRSTTTHGCNIDRTEWNTEPTEPIFGRTDLRKGVSEAKFDVEADFDVKKSLAPPKSAENHEKTKKKQMFEDGDSLCWKKKHSLCSKKHIPCVR